MLQHHQTLTELPDNLAWRKYCGFLDLSVEGFLKVQEQGLLDWLPRLACSGVGRHFLGGRVPATLSEYLRRMPLTTYEDYVCFLNPEATEALPEAPHFWAQTTRRGGEVACVPYTLAAAQQLRDGAITLLLLSSNNGLEPGGPILFNLAPKPYLSGYIHELLLGHVNLLPVVDLGEDDGMDFRDKVTMGFTRALGTGADAVVGLTSVLVRMAEEFQERRPRARRLPGQMRPLVAWRLLRAWAASRLQGRPILPRDLWPVKSLICWGMETDLYRDRLREAWGQEPYEFAASTEAGIFAVQVPQGQGLVFLPTGSFFEFLPEEEARRLGREPGLRPRTLFLDQLEVGRRYEVVVTSTNGMPFLRYRLGQLVEVLSTDPAELPRVRLAGRVDPIIDLGSFTRLDEPTLQRALEETGVPLRDWTARQEVEGGSPVLRVYLESMDGCPQNLEEHLDRSLALNDRYYRDVNVMLGRRPLRVTPLAHGTFQRYYEREHGNGGAGCQFVRVNPADEDIRALLASDGGATSGG